MCSNVVLLHLTPKVSKAVFLPLLWKFGMLKDRPVSAFNVSSHSKQGLSKSTDHKPSVSVMSNAIRLTPGMYIKRPPAQRTRSSIVDERNAPSKRTPNGIATGFTYFLSEGNGFPQSPIGENHPLKSEILRRCFLGYSTYRFDSSSVRFRLLK